MSSGERPIGAAKGNQPNTEALCQPPPPPRNVLEWPYTVRIATRPSPARTGLLRSRPDHVLHAILLCSAGVESTLQQYFASAAGGCGVLAVPCPFSVAVQYTGKDEGVLQEAVRQAKRLLQNAKQVGPWSGGAARAAPREWRVPWVTALCCMCVCVCVCV